MALTAKRPRPAVRKATQFSVGEQRATINAFATELGWMAIAWNEDTLEGIVFGHSSRRNAELALARSLHMVQPIGRIIGDRDLSAMPGWAKELVDSLQRFAAGEPVVFTEVPLDLDHLTPFAKRVVAACRRISWGRTKSYGDLAAECDAPGAARAVGTVMAKNRFPLVVPCHRVLASGGALGGYSAPDGLRMKRRLLEMESLDSNQ